MGVLTGSGEFGGVPGTLALLDDPQRPKIPFLTGAGALLFSVSSLFSSSITEKKTLKKIDQ